VSYSAIKGALNGVTAAAGRIYLLRASSSVFRSNGAHDDFIVLQRISEAPHAETFDGPTDLSPGRYQVAYWTQNEKNLPGAEKAIRAALVDLGAPSFIESISDDAESPASGEGRSYVTRFEVEVFGVAQEA